MAQKTPTAIVEHKYGSRIMRGTFYIVTDKHGEVIPECSDAQVALYDLGCLRFPLIWSKLLPIAEAHAALTIFEATGVTLQG